LPLPPDDEPYRGLVPTGKPVRVPWDDDEPDPEATTYTAAAHGPEPVPPWVITDDAARQHELGILKTGKEADVHLVRRTLGDRANLLAAKRYRDLDERTFRNDARYRKRRTGDSRMDRAIGHGTRAGMGFRAMLWVHTEFETLGKLWAAGAAVPYPVQQLGNEVMLEYIGDEDGAAPRLVAASASEEELLDLFAQASALLHALLRCGVVHGDLSPYNLLVWQGRLVMIDLPQAVDPLSHPDGLQLLERDVVNVCTWFERKGVATRQDDLLADLVSLLF
jgi:RIO kinase 1